MKPNPEICRKNIDDEQFVIQLQSGDSEAITYFIRKFQPILRSYFRKRGLPPDTSEDLAVVGVENAILKIDTFTYEGLGSINGWLFAIAQNLRNDWYRAQQKQILADEGIPPYHLYTEHLPDPLVIAALYESLESLKENDQEIIELYRLGCPRTFAEVGEILSISESTARQRYTRAIKRLKKQLENDPCIQEWLDNNSRYLR